MLLYAFDKYMYSKYEIPQLEAFQYLKYKLCSDNHTKVFQQQLTFEWLEKKNCQVLLFGIQLYTNPHLKKKDDIPFKREKKNLKYLLEKWKKKQLLSKISKMNFEITFQYEAVSIYVLKCKIIILENFVECKEKTNENLLGSFLYTWISPLATETNTLLSR